MSCMLEVLLLLAAAGDSMVLFFKYWASTWEVLLGASVSAPEVLYCDFDFEICLI